ncbi:nuclear body protein SP140-like protein [Engraulis encrasicolus]|uniref:nuclear body protein SP140-like protein n=1 Tax=Engraulis encrasicolus TaxID=184585 RepID=UPI002FD51C98
MYPRVLTEDELLRCFHRKKNEISCIDQPRTFLRQLKDYDLISEHTYQRVAKMKSKEETQSALYEMLEELERDKPKCVKFWSCVFKEHMLKEYPVFRHLKDIFTCGSLIKLSKKHSKQGSTSRQNDTEGKNKDNRKEKNARMESGLRRNKDGKEKQVKTEMEEMERKVSSSVKREKEGRAGPSQGEISGKKKFKPKHSSHLGSPSSKPSRFTSGSPLRKPGKEDKWRKCSQKSLIPVTCGDKRGVLDTRKLARGEKSFILADHQWYSGTAFERLGGRERCKNWKTSIRYGKTSLMKLIQANLLKCPTHQRRSAAKVQAPSLSVRTSTDSISPSKKACSPPYTRTDPATPRKTVQMRIDGFLASPEKRDTNGPSQYCSGKEEYRSKVHVKREEEEKREKGEKKEKKKKKRRLMKSEKWVLADASGEHVTNSEEFTPMDEGSTVSSVAHSSGYSAKTTSLQKERNNDGRCFTCGKGGELLFCSECPKSFHKSCHLPSPSSAVPGEEWLCTFCIWAKCQTWRYSDQAPVTETQVLGSTISSYEMQCQYLLLFLFNADKKRDFTTDPCKTAPNYSSVVCQPMWLRKIRERLQSRYCLVGEFISDIRLIFTNHALYNKENPSKEHGMKLSKKFEKEFCVVFNVGLQEKITDKKDKREDHHHS